MMERAPPRKHFPGDDHDGSSSFAADDSSGRDNQGEGDGHDSGDGLAANRGETEAIAKRETKILFGMRLVVMTVLICSTCLLAYFVHDYLRDTEREDFESEFDSSAQKILQSVGTSLDLTLGSVDALTVAMVSHAKATNQSWPFVSVEKEKCLPFSFGLIFMLIRYFVRLPILHRLRSPTFPYAP